MDIEQSSTPRRKKHVFIPPISISKEQDEGFIENMNNNQYKSGNVLIDQSGMQIQQQIYDVEQLIEQKKANQDLLKKMISPNGQSPQDFVVPMRFSATTFEKDQDGFFIPLSKNKRQNLNQEIQKQCYYHHEWQLKLQDISTIEAIGAGSSGRVEKAIHNPSKTLLALKNVQILNDKTFTKQINLELTTLVSCSHPNIIQCYGAFLNGDHITIAMEYMNLGTLCDILKVVGSIPEVMLAHIAFQVLKGLDYLHKTKKLIHRDIKPSNLLINSNGVVKISDFGVSGQLMNTKDSRSTWIGTVTYMSPERFRGESYSWDTDIWSLGLTLLECAWGRYPYPNPEDLQYQNKSLGFWELMEYINTKPTPRMPPSYSPQMQELVDICLKKERNQRKSAYEILQLPLLAQYEGISLNFLKSWLQA